MPSAIPNGEVESSCPLCAAKNEVVVWRGRDCRVILVGDPDYPAFCRVIWNAHVKEMADLTDLQRERFMSVVFGVEKSLIDLLIPDKVNLASLGNQVPHLHWHVIPRFRDDAHFPDSVWSPRRRPGRPHPIDRHTLAERLAQRLTD